MYRVSRFSDQWNERPPFTEPILYILLCFHIVKMYRVVTLNHCVSCVVDRQAQLERGDAAAQELVNSLQVLEVMAGAMAAELKPLVSLIHFD